MGCTGIASCENRMPSNLTKLEKTHRLLNLAIDILAYIKRQTYGAGLAIRVKIGIHTGPVIAGVIGHHKPQFSLIGDTVNTASRICSNASENTVHLSEEAYKKLKFHINQNLQLTFVEKVIKNVKGKGDLVVFELDMNISPKKKTEHFKSLFRERVFKVLPEIKALRNSSLKGINNLVFNVSNLTKIKEEDKNPEISSKIKRWMNLFSCSKKRKRESIIVKSKRLLSNFNVFSILSDVDGLTSKKDFDLNEKSDGSPKKEDNILRIDNKFLITFEEGQENLRKDFISYLDNYYGNHNRYILILLSILYLSNTFSLVLLNSTLLSGEQFFVIILRAAFCTLIVIFILFLSELSNKFYFKYVTMSLFLFGFSVSSNQLYYKSLVLELGDIQIIEIAFLYMVATNTNNIFAFTEILFFGIIIFVVSTVLIHSTEPTDIENIFFILTVISLNTMKVYLQTKYHIEVFNTLQQIQLKKNEQNNLVSQLLPSHVIFTNFF